jgi:hypothetical protein
MFKDRKERAAGLAQLAGVFRRGLHAASAPPRVSMTRRPRLAA